MKKNTIILLTLGFALGFFVCAIIFGAVINSRSAIAGSTEKTEAVESTGSTESDVISDETELDEPDATVETPDEPEPVIMADSVAEAALATPYTWKTIKSDLAQSNEDRLVITKDQLDNARPGSVLAIKKVEDRTITISVPEVRVDGVETSALDQYGVVQVYQLGAENSEDFDEAEHFYADVEFYLYDRSLLTDTSPLIFFGEECQYVTSPIAYPMNVSVASEWFDSLDNDPGSYDTRYLGLGQYGFASTGPISEDRAIKFSKSWIDFDSGSFDDLLSRIEFFNVGNRVPTKNLWNEDKTSYDLLGLFDFDTGKFPAAFSLTKVKNDLYYLQAEPLSINGIILQPDAISIAIGSGSVIDLEDKLCVGEYFRDTTSDSKDMVSIEGTDLTLTRATIESLLDLLDENGNNWWTAFNWGGYIRGE